MILSPMQTDDMEEVLSHPLGPHHGHWLHLRINYGPKSNTKKNKKSFVAEKISEPSVTVIDCMVLVHKMEGDKATSGHTASSVLH